MKLTGTFDVRKINRIVIIDTNTVWTREISKSGKHLFRKEHTEIRRTAEKVVAKLQGMIDSGKYDIDMNGESINVRKIPHILMVRHISVHRDAVLDYKKFGYEVHKCDGEPCIPGSKDKCILCTFQHIR